MENSRPGGKRKHIDTECDKIGEQVWTGLRELRQEIANSSKAISEELRELIALYSNISSIANKVQQYLRIFWACEGTVRYVIIRTLIPKYNPRSLKGDKKKIRAELPLDPPKSYENITTHCQLDC